MAIKLIMVVAYLGVLLGLGALASRRMKSVRDYYAADKQLGFWSVAFSARATGESAWLLLGLTGMGAALGMKALWVVAGEVLGVGGAWLLMSRRFKRLTDRYDAITVPDYFEARFGDRAQRLRKIAALGLVVFVTIYVSAQIDATGKAFEGFLGWNYFAGAVTGFVVVLVYIVAGGFLAVVWSDVFQGTLMVLGLVALPVVGLIAVGGFDGMTAKLDAIDPNLLSITGGDTSVMSILLIANLLLIGLGFLGSPQIFVRFLALRSESEIGKGTSVALVWTLLADAGAVLTGMVGRAALTGPGVDLEGVLGTGGENVLPALVDFSFPLIVVGLYIAVVLSAIMSTVDSLLVVASSAAVRDWYQKVKNPHAPDDTLVPISRKVTFGLATAALFIALVVAWLVPGRTVFWFVIFGWSGISATFCPAMILSLFWRGYTGRGALASMVSGFLCVPLFKFGAVHLPVVGAYFGALGELPAAFVVSFVVGIIASVSDTSADRPALAAELDAVADPPKG